MSLPVSGESKYLATIARQLARISDSVRAVYVEQKDGVWAWALAHASGPYPLLRTAASLRGVDHRRAFIGYFGFDNHSVTGDPDHEVPTVAFILKLDEVRAGGEAGIRAEIMRWTVAKTGKETPPLLDIPPSERGRINPNANPGPWEEPPEDWELHTDHELMAEVKRRRRSDGARSPRSPLRGRASDQFRSAAYADSS